MSTDPANAPSVQWSEPNIIFYPDTANDGTEDITEITVTIKATLNDIKESINVILWAYTCSHSNTSYIPQTFNYLINSQQSSKELIFTVN